VAGVLTGSWSFGGSGYYGEFEVYPPLYLYWQEIVANNPYKYVPNLATGFELSADKLTWTFKLRDGVKMHDGSAFTAKLSVNGQNYTQTFVLKPDPRLK